MTFSIAARVGDAYGVAVASRFIAVGSITPHVRLGVGAVATQARAKVSFGPDGLELLRRGHSASSAAHALIEADPEREHRQLAIISADDQVTYTGAQCLDWAGGLSGTDVTGAYAAQGNILVGEQVVLEVERAWLGAAHLPIGFRLVHALLAGDRVGGDSRGRQSAALYVVQEGSGYDHCGILADLRVDDHPEAPTELARLLDLHDLHLGSPTQVLPLEGALADEVRAHLAKLGRGQKGLHDALTDWAGWANLEMRLTPEGIDARVLQILREQAAA